MEVLLLKDIENFGVIGQVKRVKDGFARNFLLPKKLAKIATDAEVKRFQVIKQKIVVDEKLAGSRVAMLAEQLRNVHLSLTKKVNDQGKLYGALGSEEIVDLLKTKGIQINKKQVEFGKAIRSVGVFEVTIRLTAKLKPQVEIKIVAAD